MVNSELPATNVEYTIKFSLPVYVSDFLMYSFQINNNNTILKKNIHKNANAFKLINSSNKSI